MEVVKTPAKRKSDAKYQSKNHYTNNSNVRIQRNQAEKQRRDRLNDHIAQLATLVSPAMNATKPLDKVSILRLSASWMRLNLSCLNSKSFKSAYVNYLDLHHSLVSNLDILEKSINGFIIVTTFSGIILMCSKYSEDYIGYQNIDLLGHQITNFVSKKELGLLQKKLRNLISKFKNGSPNPRNVVRVHMQQRPLPRTNEMKYRKMSFSLSIHAGAETVQNSVNMKKSLKIGRHKDFGENAVVLIFVEPVQLEPDIDVQYLEEKDCYFTIHGPQGEIIFADHRISTMTGYMPRDVLGNSAYQYIHSSDVPIALFAQKDMFASSDGTGLIVYRLRICDSSFIYLQSKGQIRYKDSTKEVRQFICCNILLSAEDGRRELQKFQDRFAPQLTATNTVVKKVKGGSESLSEKNSKNPASSKSVSNSNELDRSTFMNRLSANDSANDCLMDVDSDPRSEERRVNSKSLLDLLKVNCSVKNGQRCSPFKSSRVDGHPTMNHAIQIVDRNKSAFSTNCDDRNESEPNPSFNNLDSLLPLSDDSFSFSFTQPNDANRVMGHQNPNEANFLGTDLLHDEFIHYGTLKEGIAVQKLCPKTSFPEEMNQNVGDYSLPNDIEMLTKDLRLPIDVYQNHEFVDSHSSVNPSFHLNPLSSPADIGQNVYNNCLSNFLEPFSNYSIDTSFDGNYQLPQSENGLSSASSSISETANLDMSFLDHSSLLRDLSDFCQSSIGSENDGLNSQCQTKSTGSSSWIYGGSETPDILDISISKNTKGATSHVAAMNGFYTQQIPNLHIRTRNQLGGSSTNSALVSEITNLQPGEYNSYPWNEENLRNPVLEQNWKVKNDNFFNSTELNYSDPGFSQFQTNPVVDDIEAEVFRSGMASQSCRNSQSAFLTHAQNGLVVVDSANQLRKSFGKSGFKSLK